jgi:hypothetical protein
MMTKQTNSVAEITEYLGNWSDRKKTMFNNISFINLAVQNINQHLFTEFQTS